MGAFFASAIFGYLGGVVKRALLVSRLDSAISFAMAAKRKRPKTLRQLINDSVVRSGLSHTRWCDGNGLNPRLIYRWLQGDFRRAQSASIGKLAKAVGVDYETAEQAVRAEQRS